MDEFAGIDKHIVVKPFDSFRASFVMVVSVDGGYIKNNMLRIYNGFYINCRVSAYKTLVFMSYFLLFCGVSHLAALSLERG